MQERIINLSRYSLRQIMLRFQLPKLAAPHFGEMAIPFPIKTVVYTNGVITEFKDADDMWWDVADYRRNADV